MKIEIDKIMNPAILFSTAYIANWHKKDPFRYFICKGVSTPHASNASFGCEKEENTD